MDENDLMAEWQLQSDFEQELAVAESEVGNE